MFYMWRAYVSQSIKKHQTIIWLFKWKRHHTLLRGWRKLKDSTSQLSYFINIKRKHELIASTKESWDKLARKRNFFFKWKENYLNQKHLQFENGVNLRLLDVQKQIRNRTLTHFFGVRLRLLRKTNLSQSMARWAYFASNRKQQRLRVINLMKTSRISIYRRAIRQWKTFMHNDRLFSYENMSHDRIVSSRIRTMERSCLRKSFHRWHVSFYKVQQSRKMFVQILRNLSRFHARAAFSWWKYFATRLKTNETKLLQQNRLLQNLASSKKYRMMNKMLNRWIIYIKWILKRNAALRSMLVRKSISLTRAALKIWHKKYTDDRIRCRCILRLSLIVSKKRRYLLAMTKWRNNYRNLKLQDTNEEIAVLKQQIVQNSMSAKSSVSVMKEEANEIRRIHDEKVSKLHNKMKMLSRVASKQMNEVELKYLNDLAKKDQEIEVFKQRLTDKDDRLDTALDAVSKLQEKLNKSWVTIADMSQQGEAAREDLIREGNRLKELLETKERSMTKNELRLQKMLEKKDEILSKHVFKNIGYGSSCFQS